MSLDAVRAQWDDAAATFDDEADHGLTSEETRKAWWSALSGLLPQPPARVADLGCGTGSVSLLLAEHGYNVTGMDLSPAMITRAKAKGSDADLEVPFSAGDVGHPPWERGSFDVVFARHVVWALPHPEVALQRWVGLLAPDGRLVLVEGRWSAGGELAGLTARELRGLIPEALHDVLVVELPDPALWGKEIDDERYALTARL